MKKKIKDNTKFFLAFLILCSTYLTAQNFPYGFNYQAVVRDANGSAKTNTIVGVKLSIYKGSATGTLTYQEAHSPTTNALGQFNITVGSGTIITGGTAASFSLIPWHNDIYFLKSEIQTGASTYSTIGTQQLMAVPYALHAKTIPPTITRLTVSGPGTYTTPPGVAYIKVRMVGGGGAGSGGGNGGATTFGNSLLIAGGGSGGCTNGSGLSGGAGGTFTVNSPAINIASLNGSSGGGFKTNGGGDGGDSFFGGAGGGGSGPAGGIGLNAAANSGSGGGGNGSTSAGACAGGAGAYVEAMIVAPLVSYTYTVGSGGVGGGNGGSGIIIIEEHY